MLRLCFLLGLGWMAAVHCGVTRPCYAVEAAWQSDFSLLPESTVAVAQVPNPRGLISLVFDHPLREEIESLTPYQAAISSKPYKQFLLGRTVVEGQVQMPWREALETFLAKGVTVAVDGETRGIAILIRGKDEAAMSLLAEKMLVFAKLRPDPERIKQSDYRGLTVHQVDRIHFTVKDDRLVMTNQRDLGKQIVDRMLDGGASFADDPEFQDASLSRVDTDAAWAYADVAALREAGVAGALFSDRIDNPVGEILAGGIQSSLQQAPYVTASLRADSTELDFQVQMPHQPNWVPESREYFFGPGGEGRAPAAPMLEETLFSLQTYRDFSQVWMRAGDLFGAEVNDSLAQADANLTTLFAGKDFGEDILGSFEPQVAFVATRQRFDEDAPVPTIKLPAFAAIFELREPESMTRELRRTFQSLIGFLNVVGAMNGQRQLELGIESAREGTQLISSSYVPEEDDLGASDAGIVFNFSPTIGFAGSRCVISSSTDLARQLVDATSNMEAAVGVNTQASMNASVLRQLLSDNRGQLVAQNMLEDGNSREEAEVAIDLLLDVVGYFQDASIKLTNTDGRLQLNVSLKVRP